VLGLWDGDKAIYPVRMNNVQDAIRRCIGNDIESIKVEYVDGVIKVSAYHHDGTNRFTIYRLTKKGVKATDCWFGGVCPNNEIKGYWLAKYKGYLY
jgi:hypothetical protein